ncbi:CdaR family transcriptional regulator [Pseudalkalibacillus sp. A8]|uniref:CdaR family transcriptional regulator n=1 Tax=Pseudalkalibacillus sp. A8 TaxID=3382641 RepID=UPI0038B566CE
MKLVNELAQKIVDETRRVLKEEVIVVDTKGTIIASVDPKRVGYYHEGATISLKTKEKLYITQDMAKTLKGVKPGINMPILFRKQVIGVIGIKGNPYEVEPFADLIRRFTELLIEEFQHRAQLEWKTRGIEAFFYDWVHNQDINSDFIDRGKILGIEISEGYYCTLFYFVETPPAAGFDVIGSEMEDWFHHYFYKRENDYFIRWGHEHFLLVSNSPNESMFITKIKKWQRYFKRHHNCSFAVGIGRKAESNMIHSSYNEAKKALKAALRQKSIVLYHHLLLELILQDVSPSNQNEFSHRVLYSILNDESLLETLSSYLSHDQSISETAEHLHIHINTLHYRLKQIKQLTGIDPKKTEGAVHFYIALSFLSEYTSDLLYQYNKNA